MQSTLFDYSAENVQVTSTAEAIQYLIDLVSLDPRVTDKEQILQDVLKRETISSTLLVNTDIAIPHAKSIGVFGILTAIITLKKSIDFDENGSPVKTFILIVASPDMVKPYLKKLSMIANIFGYKNM
jgi:mannitol/fructose-specific phosphotransferase system IIA component (Ntr-type)